MPNWGYVFVSFVFHLGLAVWIGGTVALGAFVAPTLFRNLDRATAGTNFGAILRKFLRLRIVAIVAVIIAAAVKYVVWEDSPSDSAQRIWIMIRWSCLVFMAFAAFYEISRLEAAIARALEGRHAEGAESASGREFDRLHRQSEILMKTSLLAGLGALLLS